MKCFIGFGSNMGERKQNLEYAAQKIAQLSSDKRIKVSPLYESPALVPENAPREWSRLSYLNAVGEIEWDSTPRELLAELKKIEHSLGRENSTRWAPRVIDLDILTFGDQVLHEQFPRISEKLSGDLSKNLALNLGADLPSYSVLGEGKLIIPHSELHRRSFVLDPFKDLASNLLLPQRERSLAVLARELPAHSPLLMAVVNLTPDSFSDGGQFSDLDHLEVQIKKMDDWNIPIIDLGAESTRPGATTISSQVEWERMQIALQLTQDLFRGRIFKPQISIDTTKPEIAEKALNYGVKIINDVSGVSHPRMLSLLKESDCDFVFMHSLSVPAETSHRWDVSVDPITELKCWLSYKLDLFDYHGIDISRAIFDPGIGFGKTPEQSIAILKRISEFADLPVRLLVGHSRKSFIRSMGLGDSERKDGATLGISLAMREKKVDILRVHDFAGHQSAFKSYQEVLL